MESQVIATQIEIILIITGAVTATMLSQFFAPLPVLRLVYGETHLDAVSMALARHWGLLIFCVGALLVYAGTLGLEHDALGRLVPPLRTTVLVPTLRRSLVALIKAPPRAYGCAAHAGAVPHWP